MIVINAQKDLSKISQEDLDKIRKNIEETDCIQKCESRQFLKNVSYKCLLRDVKVGWYVESHSTNQYGKVVEIIKNRDGVPVCLKVKGKQKPQEEWEYFYDYISIDRVTVFQESVTDEFLELVYLEDERCSK